MNTCLENIVGINCLDPSSVSGLFIQDLSGINLKTVSGIVDSRFASGLELIKAKRTFAISRVQEDIVPYLLPYFRMNSEIDSLQVGHFKTNSLSSAALNRGIKVKTRKSKLLRIKVRKIEVQIQEVNFIHSVEILDGNSTTSFPFTTDANGKATLIIDYLSETNEVFVVMDNTLITPKDSSIKEGCSCFTRSSEFLIGWGWNGTGTTTSAFGLQVDFLAECNNDDFFCLIGPKLGFAILYKTGIEIVKEWIASDRLNPLTLIDDGTEEFLLDEFTREYKHSLKVVAEQIPSLLARIDEICISCNQSRYIQGTP